MNFVSLVKPMALLAVLACMCAIGCTGENATPIAPVVVEDPAMEAAPAADPAIEAPAVTEPAADAS